MTHTRWILVAAAATAAATCYRPAGEQPCSIACDPQNPCPDAMSCISGRCHAQGDTSCAPVDAPSTIDVPSGSSGSACYGSGDVQICFATAPTGIITGPDARAIDTTTGNGCVITTGLRAGPSSVCVLAGSAVNIGAGVTFTATGSRPLVIVADDMITIEGTVSVASTITGQIGAGADGCASGNGQSGASGGGGGAGGSFGTLGGAGGPGQVALGGNVGLPSTNAVHGGCGGGAGGADSTGFGAGAPGAGGGAVYLLARNRVVVDGLVNASGAAGGGASASSLGAGGGGGGAGGYIGMDAPQIVLGGNVIAAGGGGGGGGVSGAFADPQPGSEALTCSAPSGGTGATSNTSSAGNGGAGSVDSAKNGTDGTSATGSLGSPPSGGGGGGGGVGVVRVFGALTGTTCPAPTP